MIMAGIGAKPGNTHGFSKGNTLAKESGNQARKRARKSKSRKTLDKLQELSPVALERIEDSVNGKAVDNSTLATAKWIITTIGAVSKSIAQEEDLLNGIRIKLDEAER